MYFVKNMLIFTGNELHFHFWVRHGSTHAELEIKIKTAFVIPVVQNIFGLIIAMQQIYKHTGYKLKPVHCKFKEIVNCRELDRLFSCLSRILR